MENKIEEYVAPSITDHGDLAELTAAGHAGHHLDASFPAGTAEEDLTFTTP